jgi:glucose/arabinose dehydrogenase
MNPRLRIALAIAATTLGLVSCGEGGADTPAASSASASQSPEKAEKAKQKRPPTAEPAASVEIQINGAAVTPMAKQVDLAVGEPLQLLVQSDRAGELHVHSSPEQVFTVEPGRNEFTLKVSRPGQVDVEEHESGALVLRLVAK